MPFFGHLRAQRYESGIQKRRKTAIEGGINANCERTMTTRLRRISRAILVTCVFAPAAMHGQALHPSFGLDADFDNKGSNFYGAGMFLGLPSMSAWAPYIDLYTYYLNYDAGATRGSLHAFAPTVGLMYTSGRTSVNFGGGYAWVSKSGGPSINTERGGISGATASFGIHNTGPGTRPYKSELLANYNFGSEYLWSRARASVPFGYSVAHPSRIGLELTGQGSNHNGVSSHAISFGPTLEFGLSPQLGFTVAGGPKFFSHGGTGAYISLALSISP